MGNVALSYFITGSPVDEFQFTIAPELGNVEFVGRDVRRWTQDPADPSRWTVKLQRKVIGDYNLAVTYSQRYEGGQLIAVGGVFAFLKAVLFLPARLLGARPSSA